MRPLAVSCVLASVLALALPAAAQGPPPRIPLWVIDFHAAAPSFPVEQALADSHALTFAELPGVGLGGDVALHIYPYRWRAVTFGLGGRLTMARAHQDASLTTTSTSATVVRAVTERFTFLGPELSLNFGTGAGWSYLSAGIATSQWSIVPDGTVSLPPDEERLKTLTYGGGARWFAKPHVAFSFDVRFYAVNPSTAVGTLPAGPRTTLLVVGAGISLK